MARKRKKSAPKTARGKLVNKPILWPPDWIERIDAVRGAESFSDFVRNAAMDRAGRKGLSEMQTQGRPIKDEE